MMVACENPSATIAAAASEVDRATASISGAPLKRKDKLAARSLVLASPACSSRLAADTLPDVAEVGERNNFV